MSQYKQLDEVSPHRELPSGKLAILLSLIIPGAGQVYQNRVLRGVVFFLLTVSLVWVLIGFVVWAYSIMDAYIYEPDPEELKEPFAPVSVALTIIGLLYALLIGVVVLTLL